MWSSPWSKSILIGLAVVVVSLSCGGGEEVGFCDLHAEVSALTEEGRPPDDRSVYEEFERLTEESLEVVPSVIAEDWALVVDSYNDFAILREEQGFDPADPDETEFELLNVEQELASAVSAVNLWMSENCGDTGVAEL